MLVDPVEPRHHTPAAWMVRIFTKIKVGSHCVLQLSVGKGMEICQRIAWYELQETNEPEDRQK